MFTRQDMVDYITSVISIEEKAFNFTEELVKQLSDEDIRKEIEKIKKAEVNHISLCRHLLDSISE